MEKFAPEFVGEDANKKAEEFLKHRSFPSEKPLAGIPNTTTYVTKYNMPPILRSSFKLSSPRVAANLTDPSVPPSTPPSIPPQNKEEQPKGSDADTETIHVYEVPDNSEHSEKPCCPDDTNTKKTRKPMVTFVEPEEKFVGLGASLYKETMQTFAADGYDEESNLSFEETNQEPGSSSVEQRLDRIEEKLSYIIGLLNTIMVATAGPTTARDEIRDALIGTREELIEMIKSDILTVNDRIMAMEKLRDEECSKADTDDGSACYLTDRAKILDKIVSSNAEEAKEDLDVDDIMGINF